MINLVICFLGLVSLNTILPIASVERTVFYRERAAQTYNAFWYFLASSVVELPYLFASVLLFMAISYPLVGFTGIGAFLTFWLTLSLHVLLQSYTGEFLVFLLPNVELAQVLGTLVNMIAFLFMGFSPPASALPEGYTWLYDITPLKYTFAAMAATVFGDCPSAGSSDVGCQQMTNIPPTLQEGLTVKEYLEDTFLVKHGDIWKYVGIEVGIVVFVRILTILAMRFVNHQKK